jgi:hypothetical protein
MAKAWYLSMTAFETGPDTSRGRSTARPARRSTLAFDPAQVQRIEVGTGTLAFSDADNGTFSYTVNGISQTKSITRQVFGPLPRCTWGAVPNLALAANYTDLWWVPGGAGIGVGNQLHAPGRRDLRRVVHLRLQRGRAAAHCHAHGRSRPASHRGR